MVNDAVGEVMRVPIPRLILFSVAKEEGVVSGPRSQVVCGGLDGSWLYTLVSDRHIILMLFCCM